MEEIGGCGTTGFRGPQLPWRITRHEHRGADAAKVEAYSLVDWAMANLKIIKPINELTDDEIARVMRWIGMCSWDTVFVDGDKPIIRRHGIQMMLSVTLLEFPEFYARHGLSQHN